MLFTYEIRTSNCRRGRPVFDAALSRSKQAAEYLQHPPIGSLSFGRGLG